MIAMMVAAIRLSSRVNPAWDGSGLDGERSDVANALGHREGNGVMVYIYR